MANAACQYQFDYYIVAASVLPITETSEDGWCEEFTSLGSFSKWADEKASIAGVFAGYAQGLSTVKAVEQASRKSASKLDKPKKINKANIIKNNVVEWLRNRLSRLNSN